MLANGNTAIDGSGDSTWAVVDCALDAEARFVAGSGPRRGRARVSVDGMSLHWRQSLELEQATIVELESAATVGEHAHELGAQRAARRSEALQPHRLDNGPAEDIAGKVLYLAGRETDSGYERSNRAGGGRVRGKPGLNVDGCREAGERRAKRREHAVSRVLHDDTAMCADDLAQQEVVQLLQRVRRILPEARAGGRGIDPVRAQDDEQISGHCAIDVRPALPR
jgi:hypothetical protein